VVRKHPTEIFNLFTAYDSQNSQVMFNHHHVGTDKFIAIPVEAVVAMQVEFVVPVPVRTFVPWKYDTDQELQLRSVIGGMLCPVVWDDKDDEIPPLVQLTEMQEAEFRHGRMIQFCLQSLVTLKACQCRLYPREGEILK